MDFNNLNDGDWKNLIYLTILLCAMMAGAVFRSNLKITVIMKYFVIWGSIALVAIILYAYRYEFSDFKNRIIGEVNPSGVQITKSGTMIINLSDDGHFYINVKINNVPILFMIDTGASDITISLKEAKRIGINLKSINFNREYQTANGKAWGGNVMLEKLEVGGTTFNNISASVNSSEMGTSLLGMSFLRKFRKYEFYRDRLELTI